MNKSFKYDLCPQWETYDRIGYTWMPFIMFNQTPNFRSDVLNTDNRGFRFNSINLTQNNSIFDANNMKNPITIILGGSFAFGAGASSDQNTITGYLSKSGVNCINLSGSAHVGFQELISLFSNIDLIENVNEIIFISGINDLYLSNYFEISYPDIFYFNSEFKKNMNINKNTLKKKIFEIVMKIFSPNIMEDKNIENLKKKYFRFFNITEI